MRPIVGIVSDKDGSLVTVKTKSGQRYRVRTKKQVSLFEEVTLMIDYDTYEALDILTKHELEGEEVCTPVTSEFDKDYDDDEVPPCVGGFFLFPDE